MSDGKRKRNGRRGLRDTGRWDPAMTERCRTVTKRVVRIVGSQKSVGELCGLTQQSVGDWISGSGRIPFEYLPILSRATNIPPAELRPDFADILKNTKIRKLSHLEAA